MSKSSIQQTRPISGESVSSHQSLAKNWLINLAGFAIPLAVGLITTPLIVRGLGIERFGLLTLAWAVIGYFSLFDLGIGRAITQMVAERLNKSPARDVASLAWTGFLMTAAFALIGAVSMAIVTPWFVSSVLNVPVALRRETIWAFIMLAATIPAVVLSTGMAGMLAALQRFGLINALRISMGVMLFLIPLAILPFSKSIASVCMGLMIIRSFFLILHVVACFHAFPPLRDNLSIARSEIGKILSFGGWITVSSIIGPLLTYMDRFVIGSALSVSAVAYYVTPYEMITRFGVISTAIAVVLFPAFAKGNGLNHAIPLYSMGGRAILAALAPIVLLVVVFAKEGLQVWLGDDFAQNSTAVLQWLAIGVYVNSYAQVPFAFIQGIGRADSTAKLHLLESPIYVVLIFWLLNTHGIIGVAIAWLLRAAMDATLLTLMTHWLVKDTTAASKQIYPALVAPLSLFAIGMMLHEVTAKLFFIGFASLALITGGYFFVLTREEKKAIQESTQRFLRSLSSKQGDPHLRRRR